MVAETLTLKTEALEDGSGWRVLAPAVGLYAQAPAEGRAFRAGDCCGYLVVLDRAHELVLPDGVGGFVASAPPERKHEPVGFGSVLFELKSGGELGEFGAASSTTSDSDTDGLVVRAPQAGRFYRRSAPDQPVFVEEGDALAPGRTLGLLEVMKTFNPVKYAAGDGLPESARLVRFLVDDASDVAEGQALAEVESA